MMTLDISYNMIYTLGRCFFSKLRNMKNIFKTLVITTAFISVFTLAPKVFANCQEIYGGSQNCTTTHTFSVQKLVQDPGKTTGSFVGNLSKNDAKYAPDSTVNFEIKVTNTSSQTIKTLAVKDVFPKYLKFVSGNGTFDKNTGTLTFTVKDLGAGETQTFKVTGKIDPQSSFSNDQGVVCLVNKVNVSDSNGAVNSSSSQFCVEKQVLGTSFPTFPSDNTLTTTPATGPEMLYVFGLIPTGLAGIALRKKSFKQGK